MQEICAKVVSATFAYLFSTPGCKWVCKCGIYYVCTDLFLILHKFASDLRRANLVQIHFLVNWETTLL